MPNPSKFAVEAARAIRCHPAGLTTESEYATIIDQSFDPLRKSHAELIREITDAERRLRVLNHSDMATTLASIRFYLREAAKSAQSLKDS